ncbi:MAG: PHP domain-containing protein [Candidatus Omnitrophica bacterium]|jgi:hypothetical protein|nr:PHP domain-containing protein [Candidatus Omnitrophota bacterium]
MSFADLHLHTTFSDGTVEPEQLIAKVKKTNLAAISITDHDTVSGLLAASFYAQQQGLEVIPGIELSVDHGGIEVHLLGYFIDYLSKSFQDKLESLKTIRQERVYKICSKLKNIGVDLDPKDVFDIGGEGTVGRLHVARAMFAKGLIKTTQEAFQKYIGDNGPAYVCGFRFTIIEAIKFIKDFGGIAVLAHPYLLRNDKLIEEFVGYGLQGLEVYYPEHNFVLTQYYLEMADKYKLLVTGGSDYHGKAKPDVKIGQAKIPYELVEKLKQARKINE